MLLDEPLRVKWAKMSVWRVSRPWGPVRQSHHWPRRSPRARDRGACGWGVVGCWVCIIHQSAWL